MFGLPRHSEGSRRGQRQRRKSRAAALALLAVAALTLTGCATDPPVPGQPAAPPSSRSLAEAQQAPSTEPIAGYRLTLPTLAVSSSLVPLGLNPDRTVQVPPLDQPEQAGLYDLGPRPGRDGPAVILGHVNGRVDGQSRPGVFARLGELAPGDPIDVDTPGGPRRFVVTERLTVPKGDYPTARVYSDTPGPELRLVTCGGEFDAASRNYQSNVVVFARAA